jgi:hypothetical protein
LKENYHKNKALEFEDQQQQANDGKNWPHSKAVSKYKIARDLKFRRRGLGAWEIIDILRKIAISP